ncbi:TatD family hydrolase [Actinotalea sp.]|uniref:TatD family hydrolase n=1 Tax=Actinotalea sp. TaxID=1872145 RepID=UPI00356409F2
MSRRRRDTSWPPAPPRLEHPLVDGHTHLDSVLEATDSAGWRPREEHGSEGAPAPERTDQGLADLLAAAAQVGVTRMVHIGCELPTLDWASRAVSAHPELLGGVAIHPNEAVLHAGVREVAPDGLEPQSAPHHAVPLDEAIARVAEVAAANDRIRVIGETGLDHFRAGEQGRAVQRESFRAHVAMAKELGLVLQIHDRDAHQEVIEVLLADGAPERTVFHCFSGDAALAETCVEHGWYLSFAGPVTYPSSQDLRAALHVTPLDRLLLETDAPYLPPHPLRGRPHAPYLLPLTAAGVAAELDLDLAELCARVWRTTEGLYGPW